VRTYSIRLLLALGGGAVALVLLLAFAFFYRMVGTVADERIALGRYHESLDELTHRHGAQLRGIDVALRQVWVTGAPLTQIPPVNTLALRDAMTEDDRDALRAPIGRLVAATDFWRGAALRASAPGATPADVSELRTRDAEVVNAVAALRTALDGRRRAAEAALDDQATLYLLQGLATAAIAMVMGALFFALVLRHTVRPLAALARHTEAELPVVEEEGLRITEVRQLTRALQKLQTQVADRQQSLEQSRARAVQLSRFAELVQGTSRPLEIRTAVATMLEGALPDGEVQLVEWDDNKTRMQRTWPESPAGRAEVPLDVSTCPAIRRKRAVRGDTPSETACDCPFGAPEAGTYACMPMLSAGTVSGLVNIRSKRQAAWSRGDVVGAQAYVNFASSALHTIYLLASTEDRALRDGLTGAYNRRFLDEYLIKRLADSVRHHQPLSVLLLDLDHFKQLNDNFGHSAGDRALVDFAAMVQSQIRTGDAFVRYGGEEFVLVLTGTDLEGALIVAERIRYKAERIVLETTIAPGAGGMVPRVTASIGVATVGQHGANVPEILDAADRAVYRAKARGRNRVEVAEPMRKDDAPPATPVQLAAVP
jgi:diguanylate cyclase (GGDEF)-like protein